MTEKLDRLGLQSRDPESQYPGLFSQSRNPRIGKLAWDWIIALPKTDSYYKLL